MTQALYRRYRPDTFADVIGQEHVTEPLLQALRADKVTHAYLFSGPRGCGKTTSARILARCLNCAQGPTPEPCGTCDSCVELARGGAGSLDVVEIDAASHGGVDDARDLRERATFAPARDRYKIFILDEAHMVTSQGFNALLKIVEEPPPHVKFIFATTEPDKVIGTIRSRTHHYPFRLVGPATLQPYLEQICMTEGVAVGAGVLPLVVRAGGGSVRDSLSVLDQLVAGAGEAGIDYERAVALLGFTHATLLDDVVDAIAARDGASAFRVVDRVVSSGHEPRRFVEDLLERLRDLIVIAASGEAAQAVLRDLPTDQLDRMRTQASVLGGSELSRSADLVNAALTEMTGATSPRLHLELLVARLLLPAADDGSLGLGARLDRVERELTHGRSVPAVPAVPAATVSAPAAPATSTPAPSPAPPQPTARPVPSAPASSAGSSGEQRPAEQPSAERRPAEQRPAVQPSSTGPRRTEPAAVPDVSEPLESEKRQTSGTPAGESEKAPTAPIHRDREASATGSAPVEPSHQEPAALAEPSHEQLAAPTESSQQEPAAPTESHQEPSAAAPTGLDAEVVRRRWPEVLQTLRGLRMATWVLVSQNAQVAGVTASTVTLAFTTPQLATTFRTGPHPENVQRALHETLGIDVRIETALAEGASPPSPTAVATSEPSGSGTATGRSAASPLDAIGRVSTSDAEASWTTPAGARPTPAAAPTDAEVPEATGSATSPDDDVPLGPEPDLEPARTDVGGSRGPARSAAAAQAHAAARAGRSGPTGPAGRSAPGQARERTSAPTARAAVDEGDDADPDDPDLATTGLVGAPLIAQMLGGTVIDEIPEAP